MKALVRRMHNKVRVGQRRFRPVVAQEVDEYEPYTLVSDQLSHAARRLKLSPEIPPKLASTAQHYYELGFKGRLVRPTALSLMCSALSMDGAHDDRRSHAVLDVSQMIHAASVLHNQVLDDDDMGNKMVVMAGNVLLVTATELLAKLMNHEVTGLMSLVIEHLETGQAMESDPDSGKCCSMEFLVNRMFYKTASLIASSCKCIALLAGHSDEVAAAAFGYGRNLGLAKEIVADCAGVNGTWTPLRDGLPTAPVLFALEEHPELRELIKRRFQRSGDVEAASGMVVASKGISRTKELAAEHASKAVDIVTSFPPVTSRFANLCRGALQRLAETLR